MNREKRNRIPNVQWNKRYEPNKQNNLYIDEIEKRIEEKKVEKQR